MSVKSTATDPTEAQASSQPAEFGQSAGFARSESYRTDPIEAPRRDSLRIGRLPIHFFAMATFSFACGVAAAPFMVAKIVDFFYQPPILALVHTFTLGWITASIMGVMYRYVPALTRHPIAYPRLAIWQLVLFITGSLGLISHFANGIWLGAWFSAGILVASVAMFSANLLPCLYPRLGRGVAETGLFLSTCLLLVAASIGFILGLDKTYNFLGGDVLTNLASHVHFAALGWVTLTICAMSYRMVPAFLLPKTLAPKSARWQLWALAAAVVALGVTLLLGVPGTIFWSVAIAASLFAYMITIGRIVRPRRVPIDFSARHALAGIIWLVAAIACGLTLAVIGPQGLQGSRIASAYGALGLLGWISNFIIGMSYQLFPGLVARARVSARWPAMTVAELSTKRARWLVFIAYNVGVAVLVGGFMFSSVGLAQLGAIGIALGGLVYSVTTGWTLSFAYRERLPKSTSAPLRRLAS